MNNFHEPSGVGNGALQSPHHSIDWPDSALLSAGSTAAPAAVVLMHRVVPGAHDAVDRVAEACLPTVLRLGESVEGAEAALHMPADELRETTDLWAETIRQAVRSHPLAALAAAVGLGALILRFVR